MLSQLVELSAALPSPPVPLFNNARPGCAERVTTTATRSLTDYKDAASRRSHAYSFAEPRPSS
jgi:hypothetical protein